MIPQNQADISAMLSEHSEPLLDNENGNLIKTSTANAKESLKVSGLCYILHLLSGSSMPMSLQRLVMLTAYLG